MATLNGTDKEDSINLTKGVDVVQAGGGDDKIYGAAFFNALDKIDGGEGEADALFLEGDYSAQTVFKASTINNIDYLRLAGGHDYSLKLHEGNVAAGEYLHVTTWGGKGRLVFDGSAEKDGMFSIEGMTGDDVLIGGAKSNGYDLGAGGVDTVVGGAGHDSAYFGATLTAADRFNGGDGYDHVGIDGDYSAGLKLGAETLVAIEALSIHSKTSQPIVITSHDNMVATGATCSVHVDHSDSWPALHFNGSAETDGHFEFRGAQGDDWIRGGAQSDWFDLNWGGNDKLYGGGGDDTFDAVVGFGSKDYINAGDGYDTLRLGFFEDGPAFTLSGKLAANFECIQLVKGPQSRTITATDSLVAEGKTMFVYAGELKGQDRVVWNGGAEKNGQYYFTGGYGLDVFIGGAKDDRFDLRMGGGDSTLGGAGNDIFDLGAKFSQASSINGGTGDGDTAYLDGDYGAPLKFGAITMNNVEEVYLGKGHDYSLTLHDKTIGAGRDLFLGAYFLEKGDFIRIDDRAEKDGSLRVSAGEAFLSPYSFVQAGAGLHDEVDLDGDYSKGITFDSTTLTGVEQLNLGSGNSYKIKTHDATVAAGRTLTVNGIYLGEGHGLTLDGSAETDGSFVVSTDVGDDHVTGGARADTISAYYGAGSDTFVGGAGDDMFEMGASWSAGDKIDGGVGQDMVSLRGGATGVTIGVNMVDVETLKLGSGGAYSIKVVDAALTVKDVLTVDGYYLGAADKLSFNGSGEQKGHLDVTGGAGNDALTGGAMQDVLRGNDGADKLSGGGSADILEGGKGDDTLKGGDGADTLTGGVGADTLDGGSGFDTADYSKTGSAIQVSLATGHGFGGVAEGDKLVAMEGVTGGYYGDTLEGDTAANTLKGEGGNDMLRGGAGGDTLDGGWGQDTADYSGSAAVKVFLSSGVAFGGDASGDKLVFIENLTGSNFGDTLFGDKGGNTLRGAGGNDILSGYGGGDVLEGGAGNDVLTGGDWYNRFVFNGADWGKDTITDFAGHGNTIDLRGNSFTFADLAIAYSDGDATVTTSHGIIQMEHVASGSLSADMFLL